MFPFLLPAGRRQRGAVAVIAAIALPILIGFAGLALDGGRLYMQKTELQNAADACALAASRELTCDPAAGACAPNFLINAENAGLTVAGRNRIDFQGSPLGSAQLTAADIQFSTTYGPASSYLSRAAGASAASKYVRCQPHQTGVLPWFMQVLGVGAQAINASAVATLSPAQSNCAIPIGMCMTSTGTPSNPFNGMVVGKWFTSLLGSSATGSFDWIDFPPPPGSQSNGGGAADLASLLKGTGACSITPGNVGEQGKKTSLATAWNTRFGLYKGSDRASIPGSGTPDYTGYGYSKNNWPSMFNAYAGSSGTTPNFVAARQQFKSYNEIETGIAIPNGTKTIEQPPVLQQYGADRRMVTAPVVDCAAWAGTGSSQKVPVLGYACVLMLHPMGTDNDEVFLEYRGKATDLSSPCATSGAVGGPTSMGPLVPALVQ
jgi:hypothetical protein